MPWCSQRDSIEIQHLIRVVDSEVDFAFSAIVDDRLSKCDHIRLALDSRQQAGNVVIRNVVVIIHKSDVFALCDVNQCLSLLSDAALAVVAEYEMLYIIRSDLLFDLCA